MDDNLLKMNHDTIMNFRIQNDVSKKVIMLIMTIILIIQIEIIQCCYKQITLQKMIDSQRSTNESFIQMVTKPY